MRHLEYCRENTVNDKANQERNEHDNERGNELRDHGNRAVKLAFVNIGDGLHPTAAGVDIIVSRMLPKVEELVARVAK